MGDRTISEFFCGCDEGYIASNFGINQSTVTDYDAIEAKVTELFIRNGGEDFQAPVICDKETMMDNLTIVEEVYGDICTAQLPEKECHNYKYLCRIIKATQQALKELPEANTAKPADADDNQETEATLP